MPRLPLVFLSLGLATLLAGCQLQLPGKGGLPDDVTPNAVTGGEIEVTALDAPPSDATATPSPTAADPGAKQQPDAPVVDPDPAPEEAQPEPAPQPDLGEAGPEEAVPEDVVPEKVKSERQLACEKKKGRWVKAGSSSYTCVFNTKDAGKSCTRESQCEGACLARSGTCSPLRPLLGCNEILQDNGARVTLCIE